MHRRAGCVVLPTRPEPGPKLPRSLDTHWARVPGDEEPQRRHRGVPAGGGCQRKGLPCVVWPGTDV